MRLSEAIRLGAMIRPQTGGQFFLNGGSCVFGAALEADGVLYNDLIYDPENGISISAIVKRWPYIGRDNGAFIKYQDVVNLNDTKRWTREQIADWVEEKEKQLDIPTIQPTLDKHELVNV